MFKFVRKHSQPIGDHPLTFFFYIAWKYKPSQPIGDHPLWPCPLRVAISLPLESHSKAPTGNFAAERRFVGEGLGLGMVGVGFVIGQH